MAGIYIHIPFCKQACHYCDFHFSTVNNLKDDLITALIKEIDLQRDYLEGESISTLYFGGGTPSILDVKDLEKILAAIHTNFSFENDTEISLEANPEDLTAEKLRRFSELGINRLSIGIQTFNDGYLKYLNRIHDANSAKECVENAQNAGFKNISIDLIYAIKDHGHDILLNDLEIAMALNPEHISAYCLTIEPRTTFGNWLTKGKIAPINEDFAAREFEILLETLESKGYEQYEISNFAREGYYSKHNSNYWKNVPYLGIGPSAHSFNGVSRQFNVANNAKYIKAINDEIVPFELDDLDLKNQVNEVIMTGLRTKWGCNLMLLKGKFGFDLVTTNKQQIDQYISRELIEIKEETIYLTKTGKLLADEIASQLFWV